MQIPVFETIAEAYRFLLSERRDLIAYAALPIVAVALARVLFALPFSGEEAGGAGRATATIAVILVVAVTYIMFAVAWIRRVLEGNTGLSPGDALRWSPRHWQFVTQLIRIILALLPGMLLLVFIVNAPSPDRTPPAVAAQFLILSIALAFGLALIQARLSLVLPAAVTEKPLGLHRAWELTKGNSWRMLWLITLPSLPLTIGGLIVLAILGQIHSAVFGPNSAANSLTAALIFNLIAQFFSVVGLAATVTTLAIVYRDLMARLAQSSGPPATRSQSG